MGCLCSDDKTYSSKEFSKAGTKLAREDLLTTGLLSSNDKLAASQNGLEHKSEEGLLFDDLEELQMKLRNQKLEIDRLNKSLQITSEENQCKERELRLLRSQRQLHLTTSKVSEQEIGGASSKILLASKRSPLKEMVGAEVLRLSTNNSSYSSPSHNRNLMGNTPNSVTPGSSVDLEDLEIIQVAKKQLRHSQRRSLVLKSRLREVESRTQTEAEETDKDSKIWRKRANWRSNSCPDDIAIHLDVIESQIHKTNGELTRMRRRSMDILVGRSSTTDSYGKIEKTINSLAAKKRNLETERFDALMQLQSELMAPNMCEMLTDTNELNSLVNTNAEDTNLSSCTGRSSLLYSMNGEKLDDEESQELSSNNRSALELGSSEKVLMKPHIPDKTNFHDRVITGREPIVNI